MRLPVLHFRSACHWSSWFSDLSEICANRERIQTYLRLRKTKSRSKKKQGWFYRWEYYFFANVSKGTAFTFTSRRSGRFAGQTKTVPSILSYSKTLSNDLTPGIKPKIVVVRAAFTVLVTGLSNFEIR